MSRGICVLLGAGPTSGAGIARTFARHGYAVALLARNRDRVSSLASAIRSENPYAGVGGPLIAQGFETDTSSSRLKSTFDAISQHPDFKGKPLKVAIWHVKHSSKAPFLDVTEESFDDMLQTYIKGAFAFSRLVIPLLLEGNKAAPASPPGTLIFTGTLGAIRCSAQFASYGISRAAVRQLAQSLAREFSEQGLHVVHTIANGGISDEDGEAQKDGKKMNAESVGETYLWLAEQKKDLFVHELDLRPAAEKF